jgi:hypothetical protein
MLEREEEEDLEGVGSRNDSAPDNSSRRNAKEAEIQGVQVLDEGGEPVSEVPSGSTVTVRVHARYATAVEDSAIGITLRSKRAGVDVFSINTEAQKTPLGRMQSGEQTMVDYTFELPLQAGTYTVDAAVSVPREDSYLDEAKKASSFKITNVGSEPSAASLVYLPTRVEIHGPDGDRERPSRPA